jgi:SAM-dependent methyltransferase
VPAKPIIDATVETLRTLPGWPDLRALDLSCGDGQVLTALAQAGCTAEGTHFREDDYIIQNPSEALQTATIHKGVDLTHPLPFPDATYDVVLATEVIEHLPSVIHLCSEVSRILKPGGHFVFSTPNIHRLHSRLQFLLTGTHEMRSARLGWDTPASELYSTHHNPLYFPVMHTVLHHNHLQIDKLVFTSTKPWAYLLIPFYPLVWIATAIESRHSIKRSPDGGKDLLRWMQNPRMLLSDQLMVVATKEQS